MGNSASRGLTTEWPIALIWMSFLLMTLIGSSLKPEVIGATSSLVVLAAIFGVMLLAVSVIKWFETDGSLALRGHRSSGFS